MQQRGRGAKQQLGVGVLRVLEDLLSGTLLHDLAMVHDDDLIGDVADRLDVMADEHHGQAKVLLEVGQEVEDLGANRHVECGRGLVGDDGGGKMMGSFSEFCAALIYITSEAVLALMVSR